MGVKFIKWTSVKYWGENFNPWKWKGRILAPNFKVGTHAGKWWIFIRDRGSRWTYVGLAGRRAVRL